MQQENIACIMLEIVRSKIVGVDALGTQGNNHIKHLNIWFKKKLIANSEQWSKLEISQWKSKQMNTSTAKI